jgi:hypothetical protein
MVVSRLALLPSVPKGTIQVEETADTQRQRHHQSSGTGTAMNDGVRIHGDYNTVNYHKVDYRGMTDRDFAEWERRNVRRTVHAGWVFLALIVAVFAWKFLAVVGAVVLLVWMMIAIPRYLWRHWTEPRLTAREQRRIAHRNGAAQLAARADLQNYWYLQGDPRGIYGARYTGG